MKAAEIFSSLEDRIVRGELRAGDALPTVREAAELWRVNKNTVAAAYRMLQNAGLIFSSGRNGSVVGGPVAPHAATGWTPSYDGVIAANGGNPDRALLPSALMVRAQLQKVSTDPLLYGEADDAVPLLQWARESFAGDGVPAESLFVGSGTMAVLDIALRNCLSPGDAVALEDPAYATTIGLVRSIGLKAVPMAMDAQGVRPEALQAAIQAGCKAVIVSTRAQNPTGICTSAERAKQLAPIVARAKQTLFLDDDHSSLLELAPYRTVVSANAERWLVTRSVSKFLGPDMRVAVAAGDALTVARIARAQAYAMGWVSSMLQRLAGGLLQQPAVLSRVREAGAVYRERYAYMKKALRGIGIETVGTAGFNIWVPCENEALVAQSLLGSGWRIRTGADFTIEAAPGFRVTTAALDKDAADAFVAALAQAMTVRPQQLA